MFLEALHEHKLPVPYRLTTCETRYWIQANRNLRIDSGKRTCVIREIAGIEHLDACLLVTIEWGDARAGCARLATEIERHLWISEPQAQVILVRRGEGGGGTTRREGECLHIEDASHLYTAMPPSIGHQVTLIPRDAKGFVGNLDDEKGVLGVRV